MSKEIDKYFYDCLGESEFIFDIHETKGTEKNSKRYCSRKSEKYINSKFDFFVLYAHDINCFLLWNERNSKASKRNFCVSEKTVKDAIKGKKIAIISKGKGYTAWGSEFVCIVKKTELEKYLHEYSWFTTNS